MQLRCKTKLFKHSHATLFWNNPELRSGNKTQQTQLKLRCEPFHLQKLTIIVSEAHKPWN